MADSPSHSTEEHEEVPDPTTAQEMEEFLENPNVSEKRKLEKIQEAARLKREHLTEQFRLEIEAQEQQLEELKQDRLKREAQRKKSKPATRAQSDEEVEERLQEMEEAHDESSEEEQVKKPEKKAKKTKKSSKRDKKKRKREESEEGELTNSSEEDGDPFEGCSGTFVEEAKEWVQTATKQQTGPAVSHALKHYLLKAFKHTQEMDNAQKLSEEFPMPENLTQILAPTLNIHVKKQKAISQRQKRMDYLMMRNQKLMLSGLFAFCPLLDYVIKQGDKDKELDKIGKQIAKGVRLFFFANTQAVYNRRDLFYPQMDKKVASEAIKATVGGKQLFDESVQDMGECTHRCLNN